MSFINNDNIISKIKKGTSDDPFQSVSESQQIVNGKAILSQLADPFNKVQVSGNSQAWYEITSGTPTGTNYLVDYNNGLVSFDSANNGITLQFDYMGRGNQYISTNRIYSSVDSNGDVLSVLQDYINAAQAPVNQFQLIGAYDSNVNYVINNIITYQSSYYVCLAPTKGNTPTANSSNTYWRYLMGVNTQLSQFTNEITVTSTVSSVQIGISQFNANNDLLIVHKNSTFMQPNVDYLVSGNSITPVSGSWIGTSGTPLVFDFLVLKNTISTVPTGDGSLLQDGSVGNSKLAADAKVGSLANLYSVNKNDVVSAINNIEIFRLMGI